MLRKPTSKDLLRVGGLRMFVTEPGVGNLSLNSLLFFQHAYAIPFSFVHSQNMIKYKKHPGGLKTMVELISSVTIPIGYPNVSMQKSLAECDQYAYFGNIDSLRDFFKKSNWEDVQLPLQDLIYKGNETLYPEFIYIQIGVPYFQLYFEKKV